MYHYFIEVPPPQEPGCDGQAPRSGSGEGGAHEQGQEGETQVFAGQPQQETGRTVEEVTGDDAFVIPSDLNPWKPAVLQARDTFFIVDKNLISLQN